MKTYIPLFFLFFFPALLFCQKNEAPKFLELKVTPTSMLNLSKPNLLIGAEVYVSKKIGVSLEYGIPLAKNHISVFSSLIPANEPEENWLYQRIKGEAKLYIFEKKGFADYFSAGILHTPQSYQVTSNGIILLNGTFVTTPNARMESYETAYFLNYGGKIWFSDMLFMEYYLGGGIKRTSNRLAKQPDLPPSSPTNSLSYFSFFDFSERRNYEGDWNTLFIDFGFKLGWSF